MAGSNSIAGASPAAGAGGSTAADACTAKLEPGPCEAYVPSFWYDPSTGLCEPFVYGGCGGNANRYPSRDACLAACPNKPTNWGACVNDLQCTLTNSICCGACEPVASETLIAINTAHAATYRNMHCANVGACLPCRAIAENEQTGKYFKPVCRNSQCTAIDVRESPLSECQKTSDCMLRDGAACCTECDGSGWVPLNKAGDLCVGAQPACAECNSPQPSEWDVVCLSGRCRLEGPL